MKQSIRFILGGALLLALPLFLTSCEDILGEWSRPAPNPVTPTPEPEPTPTPEPTMQQTPLTFEAAVDGAVVTFKASDNPVNKTIEYSTDGGTTWISGSTKSPGISVTLAAVGDKVMFRGTNAAYADNMYCNSITCDKDCYIYGNIMSLIKAEGFENETTLTAEYTFMWLFGNNEKIKNHTDASKYLVLPATTLTDYCYSSMFNGCTGLTATPELPAPKLKNDCYSTMFAYCSYLTATPVLKVDCNAASNAMYGMFKGCTELTTVADGSMISGNMGNKACKELFYNCQKLASVPSDLLPATTLIDECYQQMFQDCVKLEKAPKLPAPTAYLAISCYQQMFSGCKSLNEVWVKAGCITAYNECTNMFTGCTDANNGSSKFYTDGAWDIWRSDFPNINAWSNYNYTPTP